VISETSGGSETEEARRSKPGGFEEGAEETEVKGKGALVRAPSEGEARPSLEVRGQLTSLSQKDMRTFREQITPPTVVQGPTALVPQKR
jgi:hypothetical protein